MNRLFKPLLALTLGVSTTLCIGLFASSSAASEVHADSSTETINFGSASGSTAISSASVSKTDSKSIAWTFTTVGTSSYTQQSGYSQIGSSNKPATSFTAKGVLGSDIKITGISCKFGGFSGTAGTVTYTVDGEAYGSGSLNASTDVTISATGTKALSKNDEISISITNISKGIKVHYISYTYTTEAGVANGISAKLADTSKTWYVGDTISASDFVVKQTYTDGSETAITSGYTLSATELVKGNNEIIITYGEYTAKVNITAYDPDEKIVYEKVTSNLSDFSGNYLIVYETGSKAMNGSLTGSDLGSNSTKSVSIDGSFISVEPADNNYFFTIESLNSSNTEYSIKSASGYYIGRNTASNGIDHSQETPLNHTIEITSTAAKVKATASNYYLVYNTSSAFFRYYSSGQGSIALYKSIGSIAPVTEEKQYSKVTSLSDVTDGSYIIAGETSANVYAAINTGTSNLPAEAVTATDGVITTSSSKYEFEVKVTDGQISFKSDAGYVSGTSSSTSLSRSSSEFLWDISEETVNPSSGAFRVISTSVNTRGLFFNSGTSQFAHYAKSNVTASSSYYGICLYKRVATYTLSEFVTEFNSVIESKCNATGEGSTISSTDWVTLSMKWGNVGDSKVPFTTGTGADEATLTAIARYDYIVSCGKFSWANDFANRGVSAAPAVRSIIGNNNVNIEIAVLVVISSVTLIGGISLIKKSKEY